VRRQRPAADDGAFLVRARKRSAILLTLLSLGIKNIYLAPACRRSSHPIVLQFLVEQFNIQPISTVEKDKQPPRRTQP
jgi:hydroxylamine reductase (hybrid-cluster protein)